MNKREFLIKLSVMGVPYSIQLSIPKLNEHIEKTLNMQESQRLSIVIILKP